MTPDSSAAWSTASSAARSSSRSAPNRRCRASATSTSCRRSGTGVRSGSRPTGPAGASCPLPGRRPRRDRVGERRRGGPAPRRLDPVHRRHHRGCRRWRRGHAGGPGPRHRAVLRSRAASSRTGTPTTPASTPAPPASGRRSGSRPSRSRTCAGPGSRRTSRAARSTWRCRSANRAEASASRRSCRTVPGRSPPRRTRRPGLLAPG